MYSYNRIWNIANWRFLQAEAALWITGNKVLEYWFLIGIITFLYCDNFLLDNFKYFKYLGFVIVIYSVSAMRYRFGLQEGYTDGYEQGFIDAATRNCDYWGGDINVVEDMAINTALDEIEKTEERISKENRLARADEIKKGFAKLLGWVLTWRKVKERKEHA